MLLTTLRCAATRCPNEFNQEVPRWHLLLFARDAGWTSSDDEELFWCPEHGPEQPGVRDTWVVGCYTCDFEEEYFNEEDAKYEQQFHECESDTWIWNPQKVRTRGRAPTDQPRVADSRVRAVRVSEVAAEATARQSRIEGYAERWLRIRNVFLFWNRKHIQ